MDISHKAAVALTRCVAGGAQGANNRRVTERLLICGEDVRCQIIRFDIFPAHSEHGLNERRSETAAVAAHRTVPERGALRKLDDAPQERAVAEHARSTHKQIAVHDFHAVIGVVAHRALELTTLAGDFLARGFLLRDTRRAARENVGMHVTRARESIHGIGNLDELLVVAKIHHEHEVVLIAQPPEVRIAAKPERAQVAGVGQVTEINPAIGLALCRPRRSGNLDREGSLLLDGLDTARNALPNLGHAARCHAGNASILRIQLCSLRHICTLPASQLAPPCQHGPSAPSIDASL